MYKAIIEDREFEIQFTEDNILLNGKKFLWDLSRLKERNYHIIKDDISYRVEMVSYNAKEKEIIFKINGRKYPVRVKNKMDILLEKLGMDQIAGPGINEVKAPMPGLILSIEVKEGDEVQKGDSLLILEAMKMENVIKAHGDGTVKSIKMSLGDSVEKNQVLLQF